MDRASSLHVHLKRERSLSELMKKHLLETEFNLVQDLLIHTKSTTNHPSQCLNGYISIRLHGGYQFYKRSTIKPYSAVDKRVDGKLVRSGFSGFYGRIYLKSGH